MGPEGILTPEFLSRRIVLSTYQLDYLHTPSTAALLIQGSACVYSKKVEYLHALVYHALEVITSKKKKAGGREADEEDADAAFFEDEEHFLNLDDVLEGELPPFNIENSRRHPLPEGLARIHPARTGRVFIRFFWSHTICGRFTPNRGGRHRPR